MNGPNRPDRWRIDMNEQEQLKQLKEEYENMTIPEAGRERLQVSTEPGWRKKERSVSEDVPHGLRQRQL